MNGRETATKRASRYEGRRHDRKAKEAKMEFAEETHGRVVVVTARGRLDGGSELGKRDEQS